MAFYVQIDLNDNVTLKCDTPEEAVALARVVLSNYPNPDFKKDVRGSVQSNKKRVLREKRKRYGGATSERENVGNGETRGDQEKGTVTDKYEQRCKHCRAGIPMHPKFPDMHLKPDGGGPTLCAGRFA